jgi:tRNA U34 5-methylaminomethyl-2-thiouridine-forming methyltransferase MnmC
MKAIMPIEAIERKIYLVRGQKVMLDRDLAALYGVETRVLNQAVRRNSDRFPADFMFSLTREEILSISQIVISSPDGKETLKFSRNVQVFTEQGIAMLSGVLNSKRAVHVNIAIMRAFVKLREMIASNKELAKKLDELEKKYDLQFKVVFDAIRDLMVYPETKKRKIGFIAKERRAIYRTTRKR